MTTRRTFLRLLLAAIAAPSVVLAASRPPANRFDGEQYVVDVVLRNIDRGKIHVIDARDEEVRT